MVFQLSGLPIATLLFSCCQSYTLPGGAGSRGKFLPS